MSSFIKYFKYFKKKCSLTLVCTGCEFFSSCLLLVYGLFTILKVLSNLLHLLVLLYTIIKSVSIYTKNKLVFSSYLTCLIEKSHFITHVHVLFYTGNCYGTHVNKKKLPLKSTFKKKNKKFNLFIKIFYNFS